jgi:MFS family permease
LQSSVSPCMLLTVSPRNTLSPVARLLSMLLIALDQIILSTALPRPLYVFLQLPIRVTNALEDFDLFSLQGWVATSFVLAQTIFMDIPILISSIIIFEIRSLLCGVSQNVDQLIAGRTVSGVGAGGMCASTLSTERIFVLATLTIPSHFHDAGPWAGHLPPGPPAPLWHVRGRVWSIVGNWPVNQRRVHRPCHLEVSAFFQRRRLH